jgi:hypothetical protein
MAVVTIFYDPCDLSGSIEEFRSLGSKMMAESGNYNKSEVAALFKSMGVDPAACVSINSGTRI